MELRIRLLPVAGQREAHQADDCANLLLISGARNCFSGRVKDQRDTPQAESLMQPPFLRFTAPDPEVLAVALSVVHPARASSCDYVPEAHSLLHFPKNLFPVQELPFPHKYGSPLETPE